MTDFRDFQLTYAHGINRPDAQAFYGVSVDSSGVNFRYLPTSGTTPLRPASAPAGWVYYDTTAVATYIYNGASWVLINGGTGVDLSGVTNGQVLWKTGGVLAGLNQTAIAGVASAKGLLFNATTRATSNTAPTAGQVLYYDGTNIAGLSQTAINAVQSSKGLMFNATALSTSNTVPTTGQRVQYDGTNLVGVTNPPAATVPTVSSGSTTAITFGTDRLITWTASGATALTFSSTGAVDGCTVRIYFAAAQISSLTLDTTLAPAAAFITSSFDASVAMMLVMQYHAPASGGNRVTSQLFRV